MHANCCRWRQQVANLAVQVLYPGFVAADQYAAFEPGIEGALNFFHQGLLLAYRNVVDHLEVGLILGLLLLGFRRFGDEHAAANYQADLFGSGSGEYYITPGGPGRM